jgi:two-component system, chemotaxis family, protein-glutamate methylesterase/glutaminase
MSGKIRLLIAEDSEAMRAALQALISIDPRIEIIGSACDGLEAVSLAKSLKPDVMTMDVMMPHIDGVEATARIMADSPVRILMVSSFADNVQVDLSFRAMSAGALEIIAKPTTSKPEELRAWGRRICDAIVLMASGSSRRRVARPHSRASSVHFLRSCRFRCLSRSTSRTGSPPGSCAGSSKSARSRS